jgi:hypothetical protein
LKLLLKCPRVLGQSLLLRSQLPGLLLRFGTGSQLPDLLRLLILLVS